MMTTPAFPASSSISVGKRFLGRSNPTSGLADAVSKISSFENVAPAVRMTATRFPSASSEKTSSKYPSPAGGFSVCFGSRGFGPLVDEPAAISSGTIATKAVVSRVIAVGRASLAAPSALHTRARKERVDLRARFGAGVDELHAHAQLLGSGRGDDLAGDRDRRLVARKREGQVDDRPDRQRDGVFEAQAPLRQIPGPAEIPLGAGRL